MISSLPLVSIISPTYNHGAFIGDCIRSVLAQTYPHWEMIILDDGSTDDTVSMAEEASKGDKRIRIIKQDNIGVFRLGETYNKGLGAANGKYIAILEGDDLWIKDKLQRQVEIMENNPALVLCWGKAALVNEDLSTMYYISPDADSIPPNLLANQSAGNIIEIALQNAWLPALTLLIKKESLDRIGGFLQTDGMPLVDFPTILTLSKLGPFHFENEVLGQWRIYAIQTTKKYTVEIYLGMVSFLKRHLPDVFPNDPQKQKRILSHYHSLNLVAYARSGRYKLIRKDFQGARKDYRKAIFFPSTDGWIWRLRSAVGFGLSLFHMDVEWLAGLLGKKTYKG